MIVISDTSAILNLNIIGKLNLLKLLYGKVIIPDAVYEELLELEKTKGGYTSIDSLNWIEIRKTSDKIFVENLKEKLDSGESEAIVLAKELNAEVLVIDESKGRKIAVDLGLNVIGIIGILIKEKDNLKEDVKKTIEIIKNSQRPVILLGNGVRLGHAQIDFFKLVEKLNIPIVTSKNANDLIWETHNLYVGRVGSFGQRAANFTIQNSDLLISLGSRI